MYKILIVDQSVKALKHKVHNEQYVDYANTNGLKETLKQQEYDLIYINSYLVNKEVEKLILCDYMVLPEILNKLSLCDKQAFINIQILNKLIMDNISIIKFKGYFEEMVIANIIKEKIVQEIEIENIYKKLCPNELEKQKVKNAVKNVIIRNYVGNSFIRKCKYLINQKKIQEKFFNIILKNINNDIEEKDNFNIYKEIL